MLKIKSFLRPYTKECIIGPLFKLAEAILELILPTIMALIVNNGVKNQDTDYILRYGFIMVVMALLGLGCSCVCQYFAARASQGCGTDLRNALFQHISTLSHSQLDNFGTAALSSRLINDVNNIQLAVAMMIRLIIRAPFICIGSVIMAMFLNFRLALILLALIPLFAILLLVIVKFSSPLYTAVLKILDRLTVKVRENLSGIRVIRAFSTASRENQAFNNINGQYTRSLNRVAKISALLSPITTLIVNFAIIVIIYRGAILIDTGNFLLGDIVAFVNYASQILLAMIVVSNIIGIFSRADASAKRVQEVLNTHNQLKEGQLHIQSNDIAIEFQNVSFSYNKNADKVLKDVNFCIKNGEKLGIIGGTGSGKTTIINLIMRNYDADSGSIKIMGTDVRNIISEDIVNAISCTPQKACLISGTIAENIKMGYQLSQQEIEQACRIAQIDDYIKTLPDKYSHKVLRDGKNFSGGQRQRLTIARTVAKKSDIYIFDDSFSGLDFATEKNLRNAISTALDQKTVIIISQRVCSIRHCDRILVLKGGNAVGIGTHSQLFANCYEYKNICRHQLSDKELEVLENE